MIHPVLIIVMAAMIQSLISPVQTWDGPEMIVEVALCGSTRMSGIPDISSGKSATDGTRRLSSASRATQDSVETLDQVSVAAGSQCESSGGVADARGSRPDPSRPALAISGRSPQKVSMNVVGADGLPLYPNASRWAHNLGWRFKGTLAAMAAERPRHPFTICESRTWHGGIEQCVESRRGRLLVASDCENKLARTATVACRRNADKALNYGVRDTAMTLAVAGNSDAANVVVQGRVGAFIRGGKLGILGATILYFDWASGETRRAAPESASRGALSRAVSGVVPKYTGAQRPTCWLDTSLAYQVSRLPHQPELPFLWRKGSAALSTAYHTLRLRRERRAICGHSSIPAHTFSSTKRMPWSHLGQLGCVPSEVGPLMGRQTQPPSAHGRGSATVDFPSLGVVAAGTQAIPPSTPPKTDGPIALTGGGAPPFSLNGRVAQCSRKAETQAMTLSYLRGTEGIQAEGAGESPASLLSSFYITKLDINMATLADHNRNRPLVPITKKDDSEWPFPPLRVVKHGCTANESAGRFVVEAWADYSHKNPDVALAELERLASFDAHEVTMEHIRSTIADLKRELKHDWSIPIAYRTSRKKALGDCDEWQEAMQRRIRAQMEAAGK